MVTLCNIFPPQKKKKKKLWGNLLHTHFLGCKWCEVSPSKKIKIKIKYKDINEIKKTRKKKNIGHECFQEKAKRGTPKVQMFPQQNKNKKEKKNA
jgi:hypothetical protein